MGRYEVFVFLHVFGAVVWIGAGMTRHALSVWTSRSGDWGFAGRLHQSFVPLETPAAILGPLMLLVTGVAMVVDGPWRFSDTWILVGMAGYAAALVLGFAFQGSGGRRLHELLESRGPDDPEAIRVRRRLNALMWPELAILLIVLMAMTTKPSGASSPAFWVALVVLLAGGTLRMAAELRPGK